MLEVTDDTIFDYPWLYAVEVGRWYLDDVQAARLREYLLRGGFLMTDDFHGSREWASFVESMQRVFPDRPIVEIADTDEVLHVLYDVDERIQIPGIAALRYGVTYERDGVTPHWRGIYDDAGRLMVAINFNMDLGDAWEHAERSVLSRAHDRPRLPFRRQLRHLRDDALSSARRSPPAPRQRAFRLNCAQFSREPAMDGASKRRSRQPKGCYGR